MQVNDEVVVSGGSWAGHLGTVTKVQAAGKDARGREVASVQVNLKVPGGATRRFRFKPSQLRPASDLEKLGAAAPEEEAQAGGEGTSAADFLAQFDEDED